MNIPDDMVSDILEMLTMECPEEHPRRQEVMDFLTDDNLS